MGSAVQAPEPPEALGDAGLGLVGLWESWDCLTCKWNLTLLGVSFSRSPFPSAIQQYLLLARAFETTLSKQPRPDHTTRSVGTVFCISADKSDVHYYQFPISCKWQRCDRFELCWWVAQEVCVRGEGASR